MAKIYSRKRFILKPNFNIGESRKIDGSDSISEKAKNARVSNSCDDAIKIVKVSNCGAGGIKKAGVSGCATGGIKVVESHNTKGGKNKLKRTVIKLIIMFLIIILLFEIMFAYIEPIFEAMCEEKAKSIATIITNQQSTIVMNKYKYEELYTIEKDANGNIVIIKSNVVPINNMISDLTENIQNEFDKIENPEISIALGSLSGIYFLSGVGPEIPIQVSITGTVDTEMKSEFIAQGINQTLHRVYVNFNCKIQIVTPLKNYAKTITNQVVIAEHVIVGNIPDNYYNLEGFDSEMDTLNVLE